MWKMPRSKQLKKKNKVEPATIKRKYLKPVGINTFQYYWIYSDYSLSIGCELKLTDQHLIEVAVR